MPARSTNVRGELKLRLPELLRARVEAEAERYGYSLNAVVVHRLEESIRNDDLGAAIFGDAERYAIAHTIDRLGLAIRMKTGKGWEDDETRYLIADTVSSFIKHGAEIFATFMAGKTPSPAAARTVADGFALHLIARMLNKDLERRTEPAEEAAADAVPPGEAGAGPADEAA